MDDFKGINEEKGKLSGNVVLMNVANSLKQVCREGGLIARFGGEFLVLLKNITDIIVKANQALLQQVQHFSGCRAKANKLLLCQFAGIDDTDRSG